MPFVDGSASGRNFRRPLGRVATGVFSLFTAMATLRDVPVGPHAVNLARALASHANAAGECWPSVKTLANECRTSERTMQRASRELEGVGLVERVARVSPAGDPTSNLYRLRVGFRRQSPLAPLEPPVTEPLELGPLELGPLELGPLELGPLEPPATEPLGELAGGGDTLTAGGGDTASPKEIHVSEAIQDLPPSLPPPAPVAPEPLVGSEGGYCEEVCSKNEEPAGAAATTAAAAPAATTAAAAPAAPATPAPTAAAPARTDAPSATPALSAATSATLLVPDELVAVACRLWPNEARSVARGFLARIVALGEPCPTLEELTAYLRGASRDATLTMGRANRPLAVACTADRFVPWLEASRRAAARAQAAVAAPPRPVLRGNPTPTREATAEGRVNFAQAAGAIVAMLTGASALADRPSRQRSDIEHQPLNVDV